MGWFDNPADDAMKPLNKIPGTIKPYYDPYIDAGNWSLGQLRGQYGSLMSDPSALIKQIGSGYKESPGFQNRLKQGMAAVGNANAAGGLTGTPQHMQQSATMAEDLASEDYDKYLQNALGLYGMGLQGTEGLSKLGYGASSNLADNLAQTLMSKSNLKYAGQASQNNLFGGLASDAFGLAGRYMFPGTYGGGGRGGFY